MTQICKIMIIISIVMQCLNAVSEDDQALDGYPSKALHSPCFVNWQHTLRDFCDKTDEVSKYCVSVVEQLQCTEQDQLEIDSDLMRRYGASHHGLAQFLLGFMYDKGIGVEQDINEAFRLYQGSAANGCCLGKYMTGAFLLFGHAVEKDVGKAFRVLSESNEKGCSAAKGLLGFMHAMGGEEVDKDLPLAFAMLEEVVEQGAGVPVSYMHLGFFYMGILKLEQDIRDIPKAILLLKAAAEKLNPTAEYWLGMIYFRKEFGYENKEEAKQWFIKASSHGHDKARKMLVHLSKMG